MPRAKQITVTSLSNSAIKRWLQETTQEFTEGNRPVKFCTMIPGFHLRRGTALSRPDACAWRLRYRMASGGKMKFLTIGKYPAMTVDAAAADASEKYTLIRKGIDPQVVERERNAETLKAEASAKNRTLRGYLPRYVEERLNTRKSETSGNTTRSYIQAHFWHLADRDLASLDSDDISDWQTRERAGIKNKPTKGEETDTHGNRIYVESKGNKPISFKTMNEHLKRFKSLLQSAKDDKVISHNPLADARLSDANEAQQELTLVNEERRLDNRRPLTRDEIAALERGLDAFQQKLREERDAENALRAERGTKLLPDLNAQNYAHWFVPFCFMATFSGQRPNDVRSLEWGRHLDPDTGIWKKHTEKSMGKLAKGNTPTLVKFRLPPRAREVIQRWHTQQGSPKSGYVFPSDRTKDGKIGRDGYDTAWAHVKRLGGLPAGLHFYTLRHHMPSFMLQQRYSPFQVMKALGHTSERMIIQNYGHNMPDDDELIDVMGTLESAEHTCHGFTEPRIPA
ncbi:integrase family protein [Congregibacter brevis]|uniref:Integrase family protein n=1 Tax=Congregibacter brevis TaxID=3081201 RepID=A0ABZ0I907_9GAMM|nr:integrase family protein [Congregibacter sp. IMCC45268]